MKPWVKVSTCPVGKYRDTSRYSSRGWNAFYTVYQDPQGWLGEGIQDQIYPMMYFQGNSFYPFALDWQEQSNGRQVIPGLGIYFLHPDEGKWTRDEVDRQINFIRNQKMAGEGHYRVKYLMDNTQGIYDELIENFYAYPALQPPMTWLDNVPPSAPSALKVTSIDNGYTELNWQPATDNDQRNKPMYVIYASNEYPVDTKKAENIVAQSIRETSYIYAPIQPWNAKKYFAVTAIDRCGNESTPAYGNNQATVSCGETKSFKRMKLPETTVDLIDLTACSNHIDCINYFNSPVLSESIKSSISQ